MNRFKSNINRIPHKTAKRPGRFQRDLLWAGPLALALLACTTSNAACDVQISGSVTLYGTMTVNCVDIACGSQLTISPDSTLILTGAGGENTSTIDGTIELQHDLGPPASCATLLFTTNDHTLYTNYPTDPNCTHLIAGKHNNCLILLGSDNLDLTSNITIGGILTITEYGVPSNTSFVNNGLVHADTAGTLDITGLDSLGSPTGNWLVDTSASTVLRINVACTTMSGRFDVDVGALDIDKNVTTSGDYEQTGGTLDVASGKTFQAG